MKTLHLASINEGFIFCGPKTCYFIAFTNINENLSKNAEENTILCKNMIWVKSLERVCP